MAVGIYEKELVIKYRRRLPFVLEIVVRLFREKPLGFWGGLVLIAFLVLIAIFAGILAPYDPYQIRPDEAALQPSSTHLMGTDGWGRDYLSRLIYGARISLYVGLVSVAIGTGMASIIGIVSGYYGGMVDTAMQRVIDVMMAFPGFILLLSIMAFVGVGLTQVIIALGIWISAGSSRVVRGAVLSVKENLYVEAARTIGCSDFRIMRQHILPNVFAPIIILASISIGMAILAEASLSFLGYGVPPEEPSWGGMLSGQARQFLLARPWLAVFPGIAISVAVFGFNMLGDALRDLLDPRLRGQQGSRLGGGR